LIKHLRKITFAHNNPFFKRSVQSCDQFSPDVIDFDDSGFHNAANQHTISSIQIFHHNSWILGFQIKYMSKNNDYYFACKNIKDVKEPYEIEEFILKNKDYFVKIQGFYSKRNRIEALKFETNMGETFSFNCFEKNLLNWKSFEIVCRRNWKCVSLIGGLDYFESKGIWSLVYIGMEMNPLTNLNSSVLEKNNYDSLKMSEFITQIPMKENIRGKSAAVEHNLKKKMSLKI